MATKQYKTPKIKSVVEFICTKNNLDLVKVIGDLKVQFPELWIKERCANCDASMAIYTYKVDVVSLVLLKRMSDVFRKNMLSGLKFSDANKIYIASEIDGYSIASHQSIVAKLGLIAKIRGKDGKHITSEGWLITKRGFDCLRGERVPKSVSVFRNKIVERSDETTTMAETFAEYKKDLFKSEIAGYSASSWYTINDYFPNDFVISDEVDEE